MPSTSRPLSYVLKDPSLLQDRADEPTADEIGCNNSSASTFSVGLRVVGWKSVDAGSESGDGIVGTVVEVGSDSSSLAENTAVIQWDIGTREVYRAEHHGGQQISVLDNCSVGIKHRGITCSACKQSPVDGLRWNCLDCKDPCVNLCTSCYMDDKHGKEHFFLRFDGSGKDGIPVERRSVTNKIQTRGIYPGAIVTKGPDWEYGDQDGGRFGSVTEITSWQGNPASAARVAWASGTEGTYRLGYKGKVDLQCITASSGGYCYKSHLPRLRPSQQITKDAAVKSIANQPSCSKTSTGDCSSGSTASVSGVADDTATQSSEELTTTNASSYVDSDSQKPNVYEAARDGAVVVLSDVLHQISIGERSTALETKTKDGDQLTTPLIIASRNGNLDSVKTLLRYKADIEARGTVKVDNEVIEGCTPLWAAAATGHLYVVKLLIEQNADVDGRTLTNSTPLRAAAYDGRLDIVSCLVENGADVNARNNFEHTPVMVGCYNGHMNVVNYLIKRGADMDLQDKQGNTVLHDAVKRGHFEIASELLALGASQLPNIQRLTPLLVASNNCKIEMVEYFIKRPECTKEQRIEGLELLGGTIANKPKVYNVEKAFCYMKRGMEERFEDPLHPLLKQKTEPIEVYQHRKESQNLQELAVLEGNDHAIHMEGLIIRERILGTDNTELRFPIRYRGAVFADSGNFDLCIGLWGHAMEIGQQCNQPITEDLKIFTDFFCHMVQKNCLPKQRYIEEVFERAICEYERLTEKVQSKKLKGEHEAKLLKDKLENVVYHALYLLTIFAKVQDSRNKESSHVFDLIERFLLLNPRTHEGNTILHLAVWSETPTEEHYVRDVCKFPCVETMKLIINAGGNVNAVNNKGNTPLHLAVAFKPNTGGLQVSRDDKTAPHIHFACEVSDESIIELLVKQGADINACDGDGFTPLQLAAIRGNMQAVKRLVELKADVNIITADGKDAAAYAQLNEETEIEEYLKSKRSPFRKLWNIVSRKR